MLIHSQPNWPDEFQQVLAVEIPRLKGRVPLGNTKYLLRDWYRNLAETCLSLGHHPDDIARDFLQTLPAYLPSDDAEQIADSLVGSPEFKSLLGRRDDLGGYRSSVDQMKLRQMYEGTDLVQIVMLLNESY